MSLAWFLFMGCAEFVPASADDPDGDGAPWWTDCDESDPRVHPGADELCDELDQDCDGAIDEDAASESFFRDADGDGFGDDTERAQACALPDGFVTQGGDCDDEDPATYPGAAPVCGDGRRNDCDGQDADELVECRFDGEDDVDLSEAWDEALPLTPGDGSWHLGGAVALLGDLRGEAGDELALTTSRLSGSDSSAGCHAVVLEGSAELSQGAAQSPTLQLRGPSTDQPVQTFLRWTEDGDGDGLGELLLSCGKMRENGAWDEQGGLLLVPGEELAAGSGTLDLLSLADAGRALVVWGDTPDSNLGRGSLIAPSLGEEGATLLIGAFGRSSSLGAVFVASGDLRGIHAADQGEVTRLFSGDEERHRAGHDLTVGDIDGDGLTDVVIAGDGYASSGENGSVQGRVNVLLSPDAALAPYTPASSATLRGTRTGANGEGDNFGQDVELLDLSGDGALELVVSARLYNSGAGALFVIPAEAVVALEGLSDDAANAGWARVDGRATSALGQAMAHAGDVDGDGQADLLIGAPGEDHLRGAAYLLYGWDASAGGRWDAAELGLRLQGQTQSSEADYLGRTVSANQDVDADGWPDLLIGARNGYQDVNTTDETGLTPAAYLVLTGAGL